MSIRSYLRDRISIEDLSKICGNSDNKSRKKNECTICRSFANIHCVNRIDNRTWLCVGNLRDHRFNSYLRIETLVAKVIVDEAKRLYIESSIRQ
jgi:hypothetical protein